MEEEGHGIIKSRMRVAEVSYTETLMMRWSGIHAHLSLYDSPNGFGSLTLDVQGLWVDIDDCQKLGDIYIGSSLFNYLLWTCIPYQTKGGEVLCWWKR